MTLTIAFQMDFIEDINIINDSTFAIMLAAKNRGANIFYYHVNNLVNKKCNVTAYGYWISKIDNKKIFLCNNINNHLDKRKLVQENLRLFDVIFMRQDPPFNMTYITATYILDKIKKDVLIINNPTEVRNNPEKIFALKFPELMPETLITCFKKEIIFFKEKYSDIIIKPLYGNGGYGVFRLKKNDNNLDSLLELFFSENSEPLMIQPFLQDVEFGDKRIILIDGEIAGAFNRIPPKGQIRSNIHIGGKSKITNITNRDRKICKILKMELKSRGLIFVGIDIIGDYLTEINITSPTGIREIEKFNNINIADIILDVVENKIK